MQIIDGTDERAVAALIARAPAHQPDVARRVARIVARVRRDGDAAVRAFARRLDGFDGEFLVTEQEMRDAARRVPAPVRRAIASAARNIRRIAARQIPGEWRTEPVPGVCIEQRVTPLERVGCYVPAGRYPLPSSLLMTAIPAAEAGVREIVAVCPRPDATVMCAAREAGVTQLLRIGGAHAIAALAYGTESLPRVDKIVGPGSAFVTAAKRLVAGDCAIDFAAGPSEILVLSTNGEAAWIAADLIAQAEHDPEARAMFVTPRRALATAVRRAIARQLPSHPAARAALDRHGAILIVPTLEDGIRVSQRFAPEHAVCDSTAVARRLTCAGTVFVGRFSAQASGDYSTGSNHVLPTRGAARARGGLSAADFVRVTTIQRVTRRGLRLIAPSAVALADAEGLRAHAASIRMRVEARS